MTPAPTSASTPARRRDDAAPTRPAPRTAREAAARLTVLVPAYDEAASIGDTIRSLRAQTVPVAGVIVIDDCSTDDTAEVARALGAAVIRPPRNTGSKAGAQNHALRFVDTEFTMAIDADTSLAPDAVERLMESFVGDASAGLAAACGFVLPRHVRTVWERGRYVEYLFAFGFYKPVQDFYVGVDTSVAVTRLTTAATSPVARARVAWRAPSGAAALDLRAARTFLDANATLVRGDVVRDEIGGELDLRIAGPLRARALGRTGAVRSDVQSNRRNVVGGALVLAGGAGELAGRVQRLEYAEPSASGYFAPQRAETAELGTYLERESASGATLALDLGAGAQRVTRFGEPAGAWGPALRGWLHAVLPLPHAGALGVELEAYDSRTPAEGVASTSGSWRYGAASVWVRMTVR